ncbi:MAG: PEGA domain-containing protein [Treponema sp.]|nr:PEGA domain-containing protein [Treponema sp.]
MNVKKLFCVLFAVVMAVSSLSALSVEIDLGYEGGLREPDVKKRRDDDYAGVIIKTNVEDAVIYIDGHSVGQSPFATVELSARYYDLEIRKAGYDTLKCRIHPKKYYTYTYNFVLIKTCGYLNVRGAPDGASIYVDGSSHSSFPIEVDPGNHTVKVRKFGYDDFVKDVYVANHKTVAVDISMKVSPFSISRFKVSKDTINPDYSSTIGKTEFSFYVTNTGSAILSVSDRYGNVVWDHRYTSFSTWEQSITWNGTGSGGERLPDGIYTVKLTSYENEFTGKVKIDRSLSYPLEAYTTSGSGIGTMPFAFASQVDYVKLFADFGPVLNAVDNKASLTALPLTVGMVIDFANHFELAGSVGPNICTGNSGNETTVKGGVSFKGSGAARITSGLSVNFAGFASYNYDLLNDTGFAVGLSTGLETSAFYAGATGEYIFTGAGKEDAYKYGAALSFTPSRTFKLSGWGAIRNNTSFEAGIEFVTMPANSSVCIDAKAWMESGITSQKNVTINGKIGLSYLF